MFHNCSFTSGHICTCRRFCSFDSNSKQLTVLRKATKQTCTPVRSHLPSSVVYSGCDSTVSKKTLSMSMAIGSESEGPTAGDSVSQVGTTVSKASKSSRVTKASSHKGGGGKKKEDGANRVCFLHKGPCTRDYTPWHGGFFCKEPCWKGVRNRMRVIKEKPDGLQEDVQLYLSEPEKWHAEVAPFAFGDGQQLKETHPYPLYLSCCSNMSISNKHAVIENCPNLFLFPYTVN